MSTKTIIFYLKILLFVLSIIYSATQSIAAETSPSYMGKQIFISRQQ